MLLILKHKILVCLCFHRQLYWLETFFRNINLALRYFTGVNACYSIDITEFRVESIYGPSDLRGSLKGRMVVGALFIPRSQDVIDSILKSNDRCHASMNLLLVILERLAAECALH